MPNLEVSDTAGRETDPFAYRKVMNEFRLNGDSTALLVVDLQYGSADPHHGWLPLYTAAGHGDLVQSYVERINSVVLPNVALLQQAFRGVDASVIYLVIGSVASDYSDIPLNYQRAAMYWLGRGEIPPFGRPGSREVQILDPIAPHDGEPVIWKSSRSGFTGSLLDRVLWNRKVRELVVCGVATNACVEFTVRDAIDRGYDCVLAEDACAAVTSELHELGVRSLEPFCRIESAQNIAAEIEHSRASRAPLARSQDR